MESTRLAGGPAGSFLRGRASGDPWVQPAPEGEAEGTPNSPLLHLRLREACGCWEVELQAIGTPRNPRQTPLIEAGSPSPTS